MTFRYELVARDTVHSIYYGVDRIGQISLHVEVDPSDGCKTPSIELELSHVFVGDRLVRCSDLTEEQRGIIEADRGFMFDDIEYDESTGCIMGCNVDACDEDSEIDLNEIDKILSRLKFML